MKRLQNLWKKWSEFKKLVEKQDRIKMIAADLVDHFKEKKKVLKGKAILAASTKLAAARYADTISKIPRAPKCTCIISGSPEKLVNITSAEKQSREEVISRTS
jgi:type I site-specific restriction-modification system R (restriction) subunit